MIWGLTRRQWVLVFVAWLGWGFDVFDAVLFNYVAPTAIPTLQVVDDTYTAHRDVMAQVIARAKQRAGIG